MSTFGKYEEVTELYSGERGSVFSARPAGAREIRYAVKTFSPRALDTDEQFWEGQAFTERARVQQRVAGAGGSHWAPIHELGTSPAGTYYVTDFHPLSAASLVRGRVDVSAGVLYSIVRSVVAGLNELKSAAGRAHGNLKATNVLVNSRGDVAVAGAVLTDPASAPDAARVGEGGDLYALGELIYLLVLGKPFTGGGAWPLEPAREWTRLGGRQGRLWRRLCNDLLSPDPSSRPANLDAVAKRVRRLVPSRSGPSRRLSLSLAAVTFVVATGVVAVLGFRDAAARREVCAAKDQWAGGLTQALADPRRRSLFEADADLVRVVRELDAAALGSFECDVSTGRFGFSPNVRKFRQTQNTRDAVRRAERGLSPIQWRQLARAAELQGRFEARGWTGPARHLAGCIAGARPGSSDLAAGIERFLVALAAVDRNLPAVEVQWVALQGRTRELEETRDRVMRAFAAHLRSSAAASVKLTDAGFGDLREVRDAAELASALAHEHSQLGPYYDEARFREDVVGSIKPGRVQAADIDRFRKAMPAYKIRDEEIKRAVTELKAQAAANDKLVRDSGIDEPQAVEFATKLNTVDLYIGRFASAKFIQRDIDDGTFARERNEVQREIASLKGFVRMDDVDLWLRKLKQEPLGIDSRELNDYWDLWRDNLAKLAAQLAGQRVRLAELQNDTRRLHDVLIEMDRAVPPPKSLDDEVLAKAAEVKREEVLASLVKDRAAIDLARQPNSVQRVKESPAVNAAKVAFKQWTEDLAELGKDFPLARGRLFTPDVRPDEKWAAAKPEFWNDRIIRSLVAQDVERLNRLRALEARPRDELLRTARDDESDEVALHAWRLLGVRAEPAWPTRPGELATEAELRERLAGLLSKYAGRDEATRARREINDEGPRRWRRFAEAAGVDEAMLASAVGLRGAFGVDLAQFAPLAAETRFNLSLLEVRRHMRDESDEGLARVVTDLTKAAGELKDRKVAADLARRLARVGEKEPFADTAKGDDFTLRPAGTEVRIDFKRVKPRGGRPFFLATTEVSFAQFSGVIAARSAWDDLQALAWSPQLGEVGDPRRGPRVWEWVMRPAPQMYPAQLWLFPDDANDFPRELRDPQSGRFNATVVGEAAGGMPSERHPVQYLPAEAAMYYAGLVGCRLPTADEWLAAYDAYEKAVPAAEWNLRDQTWQALNRHTASLPTGGTSGRAPHAADDGVYRPPQSKNPADAAADAHPHRDGTLFFRPVDGPGGATFRQLVGNVAELVCDASEPFANLTDRTPQGVKAFAAEAAPAMFVIGGSALSPPDLRIADPLPVKPGEAFADVGFRLALTAPSKNLAEKLEWVLAGQGFVSPAEAAMTQPTSP